MNQVNQTKRKQENNFLTKLKDYWERFLNLAILTKSLKLLKSYWFLLFPLILIILFFTPIQLGWLTFLLGKFKFLFQTLLWACLGILVGGIISTLIQNKGKLIIHNTSEFLDYCAKSNGMVFFGAIGSGKTAILAMLAHHLPTENKYASFPCSLPWVKRYQVDFSVSPDKPLGVSEDIFIDETNLLFKGNMVAEVREKQRFFMHFIALSRQQGVRVFANGQRLGQFSIEQREITTAVCQVELLQKTDDGIYVKCEIWQASAWTNSKTDQGFTIFIAKRYLETYNSYWLKSLKYLRANQSYV